MRLRDWVALAGGLLIGLVILGWFTLWHTAPPDRAARKVVRVAAPADFHYAFDDIIKTFQADHPEIEVRASYGSSGAFFAQLTNRAPFDLFLSADRDYPRKLIEERLADPDTEFLYAVGHLVVWEPKTATLAVENLGIKALLDPTVKKIAIANPKFAPYGRAAETALKKLGVYDQVKDRLVLGENVAATAQLVQGGSADLGIVSLALALAPPLRDQGRCWELPRDSYPPLEQAGVILTRAQDAEAAETLRTFLRGKEGQAVLKRYGFNLAGE